MGQRIGAATQMHEDIDVILRLYELRREPLLRKARSWYLDNFYPKSIDEIGQKYPHGSEAETHIKTVLSYWDMVAGILNRGLLDESLAFENAGEMWVVWDRIQLLVPAWRSYHKNPALFRNLEDACKRFQDFREKKAPNSTMILRWMINEQKKLARK
jgi:hypothetical protein